MVHMLKSLSRGTYVGVELLDVHIFNLNRYCQVAASLMAVNGSIIISFFRDISYAFETLQFLKFNPIFHIGNFLSFTMGNCSGYYESLHFDVSYLS